MQLRHLVSTLALPLFLAACGGRAENQSAVKDTASDWCHASLTAADGTSVTVDYRLRGPFGRGGVYEVTPLWVNVQKDGSRARAVVVTKTRSGSYTDQGDLQRRDDAHLSGEITGVAFVPGSYEKTELAVVVDDAWLKDPLTGKSNFELDLYDAAATCRYL